MDEHWIILIFFAVALLYSSAGFGGGSTYLAILSLLMTDYYEIRTLALILNLIAVSISTILFIRSGVFKWKKTWPFIATSVPFALLAAMLQMSSAFLFITLGVALLLASFMMFLQMFNENIPKTSLSVEYQMILGSGIGILSGFTGIGGGIYLSPTLNLLRWENPKFIASITAFFIFCNSMAGLAGLFIADTFTLDTSLVPKITAAVLLGGFLGSYLTNFHIGSKAIRLLTAVIILIVGLRLLMKTIS